MAASLCITRRLAVTADPNDTGDDRDGPSRDELELAAPSGRSAPLRRAVTSDMLTIIGPDRRYSLNVRTPSVPAEEGHRPGL